MANKCQFGLVLMKLLLFLQVSIIASKLPTMRSISPFTSDPSFKNKFQTNVNFMHQFRGGVSLPNPPSKSTIKSTFEQKKKIPLSVRKVMRLGGWDMEEAMLGLKHDGRSFTIQEANDYLANQEENEIINIENNALIELEKDGYEKNEILNSLRENAYNIVSIFTDYQFVYKYIYICIVRLMFYFYCYLSLLFI